MIKLLILAYDFPPYVSVGGLRPYSWFKYLRRMGVEPVVITRQWSNQYGNHLDYIAAGESDQIQTEQTEFGSMIRAPYRPNLANRLILKYGEHKHRLIRKFISAWYEVMQWFFIIGPKACIYRAADDYLKHHKVDAIIATGDPFVLFRYASILSKKYNIHWIADYRDPWSHHFKKSNNQWLYLFFRWMEKKYVNSASFITTVSEFLKYKISQLHPTIPIYILPNGYDPEAMEPAHLIKPPSDRLLFGFVGTIYDWHPWKSVLRVFAQFRQDHPDIPFEVNFYGINKVEEIKQEIYHQAPDLQDIVNISGRIPNHHLLKELAGNHIMLLFNDFSIIGTKIFDYLGLRRLMLLCYAEDDEALQLKKQYYRIEEVEGISKQLQADLIEATHSGIIVKDARHFYQVLENLFHEFQTTGGIDCNSINVENYSRIHQVKELAELVKEIVK